MISRSKQLPNVRTEFCLRKGSHTVCDASFRSMWCRRRRRAARNRDDGRRTFRYGDHSDGVARWGQRGPDVSSDNSLLEVYSPSMNKIVVNRIIRANGPAPTLYLLAGIGGGEDGISWWDNTGVRAFFADKHVNVVMPIGGRFSMYTDWIADDPILGRNSGRPISPANFHQSSTHSSAPRVSTR